MKKLMMEKDKTVEISEAARMLEKKRILYDVEEAYQLQIEDYNRELREFCREEDEIKKSDFEMQKKLIKASKHLIENKNKKMRAIRRLEDEKLVTRKVEKRIEEVKRELRLLDEHKRIFEDKTEKLQKFEDFLRQIVEDHQDQYSDVGDFLQRFQILERNNVTLKNLQESNENRNESLNQSIKKYEKTKIDNIMILNNEIAALQSKLEKIEQSNLRYFSHIGSLTRQLLAQRHRQDAGGRPHDPQHREHFQFVSQKEERRGHLQPQPDQLGQAPA